MSQRQFNVTAITLIGFFVGMSADFAALVIAAMAIFLILALGSLFVLRNFWLFISYVLVMVIPFVKSLDVLLAIALLLSGIGYALKNESGARVVDQT